MCIALVGGMDRLRQHYILEAERHGVDLKVFTKSETGLISKAKGVDAMVIFTNMISHQARREALAAARSRNIPVFMHHSCGVCSLRNSLLCLKNSAGDCRKTAAAEGDAN